MSFRIFSRARPTLSDAPWNYPTNTTEISLETIRTIRPCDNASHYNFFGPLPLKAVMEILYGVKKFEVDAAVSGKFTGGSTLSGTMTATLVSMLGVTPQEEATEVTAFEIQREAGHCVFEPVDTEDVYGEVEFIPILFGYEVTTWPGFSSGPPYTSPPLLIIKDENGDYWMDGIVDMALYASLSPPTTLAGYIGSSGTVEEDWILYTTGTLELACGDFPFCIRAETVRDEILSASCTVTATEWFEYQTTAGDPAFDSATGEPINGGPGA